MKITSKIAAWLVLAAGELVWAGTPSIDIKDAWTEHPGAFARAIRAGAGFSFKYDGASVGPEFSDHWHRTTTPSDAAPTKTVTLTHDSGLIVKRTLRVIPEFGAVEYRVSFRNSAAKVLPALSDIQALNLSFGESLNESSCVISSGGGLADAYLPPRTFAIRERCLMPSYPFGGAVELSTEGGRSSNQDLPFFFIHNEARAEGAFVAFGWSGQWNVSISGKDAEDSSGSRGELIVKGAIPDLNIALQPGEEIEGPTVLVGLYHGALVDGSNRLRRLIRDVYTPRLADEKPRPVAVYDHFYYGGGVFDEALLRRLADGAATIGQEYFLLDAGWWAGTGDPQDVAGAMVSDNVFAGLGNWDQVDPAKLPNGLNPVATYVRSKGLELGLWFEPERVANNSKLAKEHPEWILWNAHDENTPKAGHEPNDRLRFGLLDFGRPEVQHWVREILEHYVREYGVKYIRYDLNLDPLPYWDAQDEPQRRGVSQLRHIKGLYAVLDGLRARHPDVILEGCASGGRRIDLETVRRFHAFWISDYTVNPAVLRFHLFGINYFLPGNYSYVAYILPTPRQNGFHPDDLGFQSLFGGAFGTSGPVDRWPEAMKQRARRHVDVWKSLRRYLVEDYYPLSEQPADLRSWSGWQFHDPADQSGFIQTFRANTSNSKHRWLVRGLQRDVLYRFVDAYSQESFEKSGWKVSAEGIELTQSPMSSRILTYRKSPK